MLLSFALTGCKSSDYNKAVELQESGNYAEALEMYEDIGEDYKDISDRLEECKSFVSAINAFNEAVSELEDKNAELDNALADAGELVNGDDKSLDENLRTTLETVISETKALRVSVPDMDSNIDGIYSQVEEISSTDYATGLNNLSTACNALDKSIQQFNKVNNPSEEYVIQCLEKVEHVVDISAVTEDNDPNGQLGKAGGYTATVYFSSDWVNQSDVYGDTIIDKGTDAGGTVEVYANVEDAETRNEYLASFDGGVFSSGSHTVVGTCVIRTSNELVASKQTELETNIIEALTNSDN